MGAASSVVEGGLTKKGFDTPDDVKELDKVKLESVQAGGVTAIRMTHQPGWKWTECVKPVVGTDSCTKCHIGVCVSGRMCAKTDDGSELEIGPNEMYCIPPGHEGWVVGDEPCVAYDIVCEGGNVNAALMKKSFSSPDSTKELDKVQLNTVQVASLSSMQQLYQPGWKWVDSVKPVVGTDSCGKCHVGVCVAGTMHVKMDDGSEIDVVAGDAYCIPPGHEGWVEGDETCVMYDFDVVKE